MSSKDLSPIEKQRHSAAHLLAMAVLAKMPNAKLAIGPSIENGFYYDFELENPLSIDNLPALEKQMKLFIKQGLGFKRAELSITEAKTLFSNQPYKQELIEQLSSEGESIVSTYKTGEFVDLCKGGHVTSTTEINPDGLKLTKIAGAYWRGDENRPMLQRVYGLLFESKEQLDTYLRQQEEAEARDHKRLGKELDLFAFSELVGAGLPLWTPKGTILRNLLDEQVWSMRKAKGYVKVEIPHITKKELYEKSGHWDKFADELFRIKTREGHEFAMKPMNCPHHTQIYARKAHSYRELPVRYANTTMCYRDEQTGELAGLSRVRSFTQDDAHVFCRSSQIRNEVNSIWDIVERFYATVGFSELTIRLSRRDPNNSEKYLGDNKDWDEAEDALREIIKIHDKVYIDGIGEAAFYGPKIDFIAKDALGRSWQVATIQLDFNMPKRFDLYCTNEKGEKERVTMIHAAIMGSIDRFLSILIEHHAGAFPAWLSPVQVMVIPISDKYINYASEYVVKPLLGYGIRTEIDDANESVGKKIRNATKQKIPYILVVGEKEEQSGLVSVRSRDNGELGSLTLEQLIHDGSFIL